MTTHTHTHTHTRAALRAAFDRESYEYLAENAPEIVVALAADLNNGMSTTDVRFLVQSYLGQERKALALRCEQAARYLAAQREA